MQQHGFILERNGRRSIRKNKEFEEKENDGGVKKYSCSLLKISATQEINI